jgi:hypothetical protein
MGSSPTVLIYLLHKKPLLIPVVLDDNILEFINTKLDFYNKLTEDQVNTTLKQRWYEMCQQQLAGG